MLQRALRHRWLVIFISLSLLIASLTLLPLIGSEFLPPSDEGEIRIVGEMEVGTRIDLLDKQTRLIEQIVFPAVPETVSSVTRVGTGWRNTNPNGEIRLSLTPAKNRERSNVEIAAELRRLLDGKIPGMKIRVRAPQGQFILQRILGGDQGLTVEVKGFDLATLDTLAERAGNQWYYRRRNKSQRRSSPTGYSH